MKTAESGKIMQQPQERKLWETTMKWDSSLPISHYFRGLRRKVEEMVRRVISSLSSSLPILLKNSVSQLGLEQSESKSKGWELTAVIPIIQGKKKKKNPQQ